MFLSDFFTHYSHDSQICMSLSLTLPSASGKLGAGTIVSTEYSIHKNIKLISSNSLKHYIILVYNKLDNEIKF